MKDSPKTTVETATQAEPLTQDELESVNGGIALLLPAVQAAREAARSSPEATVVAAGDISAASVLKR